MALLLCEQADGLPYVACVAQCNKGGSRLVNLCNSMVESYFGFGRLRRLDFDEERKPVIVIEQLVLEASVAVDASATKIDSQLFDDLLLSCWLLMLLRRSERVR